MNTLDQRILSELESGPLSTSQLARRVGMKTDQVRRLCKRLERDDILRSERRRRKRPLLFFPTSGDIITQTNYKDIQKLIEQLKGIAQQYQLPRKAEIPKDIKVDLRNKYKTFLREYAADLTPRQQKQVRAFENQLMTVLNHTNIADVLGPIGLRGFFPEVIYWSLTNTPRLKRHAVSRR